MGLHVGTSGWSYPSGEGRWNGLFYPASRSKRAGTAQFDELRFYAEQLRQLGQLKSDPDAIVADGAELRFLNELKRELKA